MLDPFTASDVLFTSSFMGIFLLLTPLTPTFLPLPVVPRPSSSISSSQVHSQGVVSSQILSLYLIAFTFSPTCCSSSVSSAPALLLFPVSGWWCIWLCIAPLASGSKQLLINSVLSNYLPLFHKEAGRGIWVLILCVSRITKGPGAGSAWLPQNQPGRRLFPFCASSPSSVPLPHQ